MANNKIQIKRSVANVTVTGLSNGELAFTQASNTFWIGAPDGTSGSIRIGGQMVPGTLTANQALVANATSGIDKIITGNAVITTLWANGAAGTNGQVLVTNGTAVYWGTGTSGSNTYVQFNDSGVANGVAGFTFDKTSNTLFIGNNVWTTTVNASSFNAGAIGTGTGGTVQNTTTMFLGNNTINTVITSAGLNVNGSAVVANSTGVWTTGTVNGATISVGTNFIANTTRVTVGSGVGFSANGSLGTANQVLRSNGSSIYWDNDVGDISGVTAGNGLTGGGTSGDITVSVLANNGIVANSTGVWAKAANGISVDAGGINVLGNTGVTVNTSGVFIGQPVATTSSVTFANVVTTDLTVNGNSTLGDATSDKVTINARVGSAFVPIANVTYDIGANTLRWANVYANSLVLTSGATFGGNVSIDGSLTVTGNVTTVNVQSVVVSDPMIYLAGNNYSSDLVDIGLAGNYNDGVTNRHTGIFRDHTDGLWKLFYNLTQELSGNNDVDTSDPSYKTATLVAYLSSGGLSTNTTSANLVANSTYTVGIVANTLTLSTALAGTSGGTGKSTVTNNALLFGNSTNGYNELTLGTSGYVLQSNGTAIVYDYLDGGTF